MDSNLDEIESRQTSLRRAYETANAQASSIVRFTLQWKELEEHIESTKNLVRTRFEELQRREKEIGVKEKHLEAQDLKFKSERDSKANDLHRIQRLIEEKQRGLDAIEKRFSEVEEFIREKEVECGLIQKRIEERRRKLSSVEEKLGEQIRVKETQLKYVQGLVEKQWKEYDFNDEKIRVMDMKEKGFGLLKKSMEEWATKLEVKERELQRWVEKLEGKQKDISSKFDELNLIDKRVHECLKEVQLKEQQLYSLEKSLHAHSHRLQKKGREIELKQEQCDLDLVRKSMEVHTQNLKAKENSHQLKVEQLENTPPAKNGNRDGRGLQLLMNQHLRRNDLMLKEIEDILQASPDAAKLVLDAMHGFYPSNSTGEDKNKKFDLTVVRRSCNFLLRELNRVSPKVSPQVSGEATKLAAEWKAKMKTDNWLEVLGFLLLLAAYDLSSDYDMKQLESFVGIVAQYYDTAELCPALGISVKAPVQDTPGQSTSKRNPSSISCFPDIKNEKPADSPQVNIQRTTTTNTDARNLQVFPNEHLSIGNQLIQNPVVSDGSSLVGLAGKVLAVGLILDLIAKKQLLEAVVFSCNLRLTDMFPPVPLLKECVEGAIRNGSKVVDDQIFVLKAVIECIKDYNLECEFPSKDIELQLLKLERLKVDPEAACLDVKPIKQQSHRRRRRKRDSSTYVSEFQPPQLQKKKHIKCYHCNEPGHVQSNCSRKC